MAEGYSTGGLIARVIALLVIIVILIMASLVWLNMLGVINMGERLGAVGRLVGISASVRQVDINDPDLIARERLNQDLATLSALEFDINQRLLAVTNEENRLLEWESQLNERENSLRERQQIITNAELRYADVEANLLRNAGYLMNMPPQQAIAILLGMTDHDIVDNLRAAERLSALNGSTSLVPVWLMMMAALPDNNANGVPNSVRTANVVRLMAMRGNLDGE
ncbi:MAG: hypothetical protein FWE37_08110 [Spirochaetaceae bacterium]|nr:hypothetical protein [Spirochaetaceae bacterium]